MTDSTQQARAASIPDAAIEAAAKALQDHRKGALTCYDHDAGWCCECGTHEILIHWHEHAARAVLRAVFKRGLE